MQISRIGTNRDGEGVQAFGRSGVQESLPEPLNARTPERLTPGFTLIELVVVVLGLALLAAAVVPSLRGAGHQEDLAGVAARVAASARFARDEAVERQAAIVLTVEPQPAAVRLAVDSSGTTNAAALGEKRSSVSLLPSAFALVPLPTRVHARLEAVPETLNSSMPAALGSGSVLQTLKFPPDGRTPGGAVVLTDDRGRIARVVVTPASGAVLMEPGRE